MRRLCSVIWLLLALSGLSLSAANAQVICVSNVSPPPELPVYAQPPIPAPGYIWTPGYWAGGPNGYFWVPGTWVLPPAVGLLWTPGYWSWRNGIYVWDAGYWGPHVGFYGGIDYGFGYGGNGYEGGHWENGVFAYNRTVNNFGGVRITNVYEKNVIVNSTTIRVSFNGGSGGTTASPTPEQEAAAREKHVAAIPAQFEHERMASSNKSLLASENHGLPPIAATSKPSEFSGHGVVAAREFPSNTTPTTPGLNGGAAMAPNMHKPLEKEQQTGKSEGTFGTPQKPLIPESRLPGNAGKPPNLETRPLNTASKPPVTTNELPGGGGKNLGTVAHPQVMVPHQTFTTHSPPPPPPPRLANTPKPPPGPPAPHPVPNVRVNKDKKPPQ